MVTVAGRVMGWELADGPSSWQQQLCGLQPESPVTLRDAESSLSEAARPGSPLASASSAGSIPENAPSVILCAGVRSPPSAWQLGMAVVYTVLFQAWLESKCSSTIYTQKKSHFISGYWTRTSTANNLSPNHLCCWKISSWNWLRPPRAMGCQQGG